jgi:hypothetical protein
MRARAERREVIPECFERMYDELHDVQLVVRRQIHRRRNGLAVCLRIEGLLEETESVCHALRIVVARAIETDRVRVLARTQDLYVGAGHLDDVGITPAVIS